MPDAYCQPCRQAGRMESAERIVAGVGLCHWHFQKLEHPAERAAARDHRKILEGNIHLAAPGGNAMPKQLEQSQIEALRRDVAAGMAVRAAAKKHGISAASAYRYAGGGRSGKSAGRRGCMKAQPGQPVNGVPTIVATRELCLSIFSGLPLEKQAALLNKLAEL